MTSTQPTSTSRSTGRITGAAVALLASIGVVVGFAAFEGDAADGDPSGATTPRGASPSTDVPSTTTRAASRPAYVIIQDEIDRALAERQAAAPTSPTPISPNTVAEQQGLAPVRTDPPPTRPAYLIIQDEIDRALAERDRAAGPGMSGRPDLK